MSGAVATHEAEPGPADLGDRLTAAGLRATPARIRILAATVAARMPAAAEQIFRRLQAERTPIGIATVYRVLNELSSAGLLQRGWIPGHTGARAVYSPRMEPSAADAATHRLVCGRCGHSIPFADTGLPERVRRAAGLSEQTGRLTIVAECLGCRPACPSRIGKRPDQMTRDGRGSPEHPCSGQSLPGAPRR
ncbi:Fur family transcriptional regulator [Pseudothauera rhizosphaerae]|uniref:Transcriptional repressor n=1 Tax=Pseudothauera rhizosphaerae TaxID=2565932 RepID=A0A4S4AS26_9RHOO|nr:transcriptional repressor [Pseudothauera rhizosphaerae]THF62605.1 transcriptional repressor [Pseudothauera rhizosphaerae]